ncbi:hypothetical protein KSP40_PGU007218 [Platanthera guangdongensis]|uniref:Uncharacterized protein n=1 Tax=Platanthera guangdongensis TaxID=2320717 RepID=A0ABR2M510_9ASPA
MARKATSITRGGSKESATWVVVEPSSGSMDAQRSDDWRYLILIVSVFCDSERGIACVIVFSSVIYLYHDELNSYPKESEARKCEHGDWPDKSMLAHIPRFPFSGPISQLLPDHRNILSSRRTIPSSPQDFLSRRRSSSALNFSIPPPSLSDAGKDLISMDGTGFFDCPFFDFAREETLIRFHKKLVMSESGDFLVVRM